MIFFFFLAHLKGECLDYTRIHLKEHYRYEIIKWTWKQFLSISVQFLSTDYQLPITWYSGCYPQVPRGEWLQSPVAILVLFIDQIIEGRQKVLGRLISDSPKALDVEILYCLLVRTHVFDLLVYPEKQVKNNNDNTLIAFPSGWMRNSSHLIMALCITSRNLTTCIASLSGPQNSRRLYFFELEWKYTRTMASISSWFSLKRAESPYSTASRTWCFYINQLQCTLNSNILSWTRLVLISSFWYIHLWTLTQTC